MDNKNDRATPETNWFVGAFWGDDGDQTPRFLKEGIWENGHSDQYLEIVNSMKPGERIAIKSIDRRAEGIPFENRGKEVPLMKIKAIGKITENIGDGSRLNVDWTSDWNKKPREWYQYIYLKTIWRVESGSWQKDNLIDFTFNNGKQDISRFLSEPRWKEKYGDASETSQFAWTNFYEAVADKLLEYVNNRSTLVEGIHEIASRTAQFISVMDKFPDGSEEPLQDICPFTVIGTFNRTTTNENRRLIAEEIAKLLGVTVPVPKSFDGVPLLNPNNSWFFSNAMKRGDGDIDKLWKVFDVAKQFVISDNDDRQKKFIEAYNDAVGVRMVAWNLSIGLYWAQPWEFLSLDSKSRNYIEQQLDMSIPTDSRREQACDGDTYMNLIENLKNQFEEESFPAHSFPELSLNAHLRTSRNGNYSVDQILADGCFLDKSNIERMLKRLRLKMNLIIEGPPGTGKTWIAKRLAYALIEDRDDSKVRVVQFHPNLSYEDFIRGWRPGSDGRLTIKNGVFMDVVHSAINDQNSKFVVVIEEINRGNPAQIFGEMLTLLEAGKRTSNDAIELTYPDPNGDNKPVYIPQNLYVIGTMNIADRSLALMDLAFRRRFAYITLKPMFNDIWRNWVVNRCGVDSGLANSIQHRMERINEMIRSKSGSQFEIGHSYLTPDNQLEDETTRDWFKEVVTSEISPMLREFYFDDFEFADNLITQLLQDW